MRLQPQTTKPAAAPVRTIAPHPLAWREARRLAGYDVALIEAQPDGSVLVFNARHGAAEAARRRRSPLRPATPPPARKRRS